MSVKFKSGYRNDKVYPKTLNISVGEEFNRLPRDILWQVVEGSYPIYGRIIINCNLVSKHKAILELSEYMYDDYNNYNEPSDYAILEIFGNLDKYIDIN